MSRIPWCLIPWCRMCHIPHVSYPLVPHVSYPLVPQGSQVYARALAKAGILTSEEADKIVEGLKKVGVQKVEG